MTAIIARFKNSGVPHTGLTPTVTINKVAENGVFTEVVTSQIMTEKGDGFYVYDFTSFNVLLNYVFSFDAGTSSDSRYLESSWSGVQSVIDQIPRGGGGGSVQSLTKSQIDDLANGLKESLEGLFDDIEIQVDMPEDTGKKDRDAFLMEFKKASDKHQSDLFSLIDSKVKEIKTPVITNEVVDTKGLEVRLNRLLTESVLKTGSKNKTEIDSILGDFASWLTKDLKGEVKKLLERERGVIKAELERELVEEFRKKL